MLIPTAELAMVSGRKLDLLHRYLREVWEEGDVGAVEQFLAPTYVRHRSPTQPPLDRSQQIALLRSFRAAFPDITLTLETASDDGDLIWFRSTMRGTHRGDFMGIAATGRSVTVALLDLWRVQDERVVEQWGGPDIHDLVSQLGGIPAPPDDGAESS